MRVCSVAKKFVMHYSKSTAWLASAWRIGETVQQVCGEVDLTAARKLRFMLYGYNGLVLATHIGGQ
jgi:hypothetical protein